MEIFTNEILKQDKIKFRKFNPKMLNSKKYLVDASASKRTALCSRTHPILSFFSFSDKPYPNDFF